MVIDFQIFKKSKERGFTLIELLVVIAIIGVIASVTFLFMSHSRTKARDTIRISDLTQIAKALELYYYDNNGQYPPVNAAQTSGVYCGSNWCTLETALAKYLAKLPRDPLGLQTNYRYYYDADSGDNYKSYGLMARMEDSGNTSLVNSDGGYYSGGANGQYYEIGSQPRYCMNHIPPFIGGNRNWWGAATTVCVGGN